MLVSRAFVAQEVSESTSLYGSLFPHIGRAKLNLIAMALDLDLGSHMLGRVLALED